MTLNSNKYYNRDLSWLRFNHRVLQEASDKRNSLYERIKFLAIFSSNLDEFFKVRVSDIRKIKGLNKSLRKKLIVKPNKLLKEIKKQVHIQQEEFGSIYRETILVELKNEGIHLIDQEEYNDSQKQFAQSYYSQNILPNIELEIVKKDKLNDEILVENEELYLIALTRKNQFIIVKIPSNHSRFIQFPKSDTKYSLTFIDDIMKYNLSMRYKTNFYALKLSRDAELYIENEYSGDLLQKIKNSLNKRQTGQVTRALIDNEMPSRMVNRLMTLLDINETDIVEGGVYHNFKDFFSFPNPTEKKLSYEKIPLLLNATLSKSTDLFETIKNQDILLHYPYESFNHILDILKRASTDPKVSTIKITLYRVSTDSLIATYLIDAANNGKKVFAFVETKARFDEENNIKWGGKLENAGVKVLYSYPGIKIHSKILYIEREESQGSFGYGYISTGNFNEKTSEIYTDFGLLTADSRITNDLLTVFNLIEGSIIIPKTKKLLVSPYNTRKKISKAIKKEILNAKEGKQAYLIFKMNSLQDPDMINLLYEASNAGVKIQLIVRGICCLVPGIKDQSENIQIISIVDRFLEHGRIYLFANNGNDKMYIGSADLMTRNLDHRIEVLTPILDTKVFDKLKNILKIQLEDSYKARIIDSAQQNIYISSKKKVRAQTEIYNELSKESITRI